LSDYAALGLALFAVGGAGALAWALGKLGVPIGQTVNPSESAIDLLMSGPIAAYRFPPKRPEDVSEESNVVPNDMDIRIKLAEQGKEIQGLSNTVEREFSRMAEALKSHADVVSQAFTAMKSDFVSKGDAALIREDVANLKKIVYGACGVTLLSVVGALLALVVKS